MFNISVISDEISHDLSEAIDFAKDNNLDYIELRTVGRTHLIDLEMSQILNFSRMLDQAGLKCFCYPSPLLKWPLDFENSERLIDKGFEIAHVLGCKYIRIFSHLKSQNFCLERFAEKLVELNALAETEDKYLLLENEPVCNLQTFHDLFTFIQKYRFSRILLLPDLGNQTQAKSVFELDELVRLAPFSPCIHVKDYSHDKSAYVTVGEGDSYISESLDVFREMDFKPVLTLETHASSNQKMISQRSLDKIRNMIGCASYVS